MNAVIHPVSTEVRKVVKEEQVAADKALEQKREDIEELVKPAEVKPVDPKQARADKADVSPSPLRSGARGEVKIPNLRPYGIGAGILLVATLGIFWISSLVQNAFGGEIPEPTLNRVPVVSFTPTQTESVQISPETPALSTVTPTLTPLGIGSTLVSLKDDMTLLYVPEGEFQMGFQGQEIDEKPVHSVFLDAFWIDQTEVTTSMYALCVSDGACLRPYLFKSSKQASYYGNSNFENYPVIYVSWENAQSYCQWADRRLPTEAEWEKAARGKDQRSYPWGEEIDCSFANYFNENRVCVGDTSPVRDYTSSVSPFGAYDMAGNVWEWVEDWYDEAYYRDSSSQSTNPTGPESGIYRVARGGSWENYAFLARSANRGSYAPDSTTNTIGFRCAMDASE